MKNFKKDDCVKIIKGNDFVNDISNEYVGRYAYINQIDKELDNFEVQICDTDITFWIPIDCIERVKDDKLTEILKETDFTQEEYQTFRKVLKHYQAEDLQYRLDEKLEYEDLTQGQYDRAVENAEEIIERYDETNNEDWFACMDNAIDWVVGNL